MNNKIGTYEIHGIVIKRPNKSNMNVNLYYTAAFKPKNNLPYKTFNNINSLNNKSKYVLNKVFEHIIKIREKQLKTNTSKKRKHHELARNQFKTLREHTKTNKVFKKNNLKGYEIKRYPYYKNKIYIPIVNNSLQIPNKSLMKLLNNKVVEEVEYVSRNNEVPNWFSHFGSAGKRRR